MSHEAKHFDTHRGVFDYGPGGWSTGKGQDWEGKRLLLCLPSQRRSGKQLVFLHLTPDLHQWNGDVERPTVKPSIGDPDYHGYLIDGTLYLTTEAQALGLKPEF